MILIIKNRNRTFSLFDISRFWKMSKLNIAPFGVYIMSICGNLYSPLGIVVGSERFEPAHVGSILLVSECPERSFGDIRNSCLVGAHGKTWSLVGGGLMHVLVHMVLCTVVSSNELLVSE
jgi:hypothetical protein